MKNLIFAIVAIATISLTSCKGNDSKTETTTTDTTAVVTDTTAVTTDTTAVDTTTVK